MKPKIDPNKWYCENSIPCIKEAKRGLEICLCARGTTKKSIWMSCKKITKSNYVPTMQGFWLLMKINKNNT